MGSRILSRSFQVEKWCPSANDEEEDGVPQAEMDVGGGHLDSAEPDEGRDNNVEEEHVGDSDDEDDDDSGDVAMVPMADMLNARFGCNNVCYAASVLAHIQLTARRRDYSTNNWNLKWSRPNQSWPGTKS